jgi:hypothetical protein
MVSAIMTTLLLAITVHAYAATAQAAAIGALYSDPARPAVVKRLNVVGVYAAVLTAGGRIEGEPVDFAILVRRFSFGWQALDTLDSRCTLNARRLGSQTEAALAHGMPNLKDDRPCPNDDLRTDAGPLNDVEAVRRIMRGPLIPYVVVSRDWAMGEWYGGGGGESLYRKRDGRWHLVESGGGAMGVDDMRRYGVPESDWCKFGIAGAKC